MPAFNLERIFTVSSKIFDQEGRRPLRDYPLNKRIGRGNVNLRKYITYAYSK